MENTTKECCTGTRQNCTCKKMPAVIVVLFGALFLLGNLNMLQQAVIQMAWPVLVIIFGLMMLFKDKCKCSS